jgi:hypothetical protein
VAGDAHAANIADAGLAARPRRASTP